MFNISVVFKILVKGESLPPGYFTARRNIVVDVKIYIKSKARRMKDGHWNQYPKTSNYADVV